MKTLNMVYSAPTMLRINTFKHYTENEVFRAVACEIIRRSIAQVKSTCDEIIPEAKTSISILYNAYTEPEVGKLITDNNRFGFDEVMADSGGLQVVTLGKDMNRELMQTVYKDQRDSDLAMSFDEIPARNALETGRANTNRRVYYPSMADECATKTATNINEQLAHFDEHNANAKVMFITQGNTLEDVVKWFDIGYNIIDKELWANHIGGLALSTACMGNGEQETIENFLAYLSLVEKYGQATLGNKIHLLGYGSVTRLAPCISMFLTNGMQDNLTLSFDSSSISMSLMMGKFIKANGETVSMSGVDGARQAFQEVIYYFKDILLEAFGNVDLDAFVEHCVERRRSLTALTDNTVEVCKGNTFEDMCKILATMAVVYQTIGLWRGIKAELDVCTIIEPMCQQETVSGMVEFFNQHQHHFKSNRIHRDDPNLDFESYFQ